MKILALDTSGTSHSMTLLEEGRLVAERAYSDVPAHTEILLPTLQALLDEAQWNLDHLDLLALTLGPGSFTGLRIGLSALKAIAYAKQKPIVGIDTLRALAAPHWPEGRAVLSCMDARRGEVYASLTRRKATGPIEILISPRLWSWQALQEFLVTYSEPFIAVGSGLMAHPQLISSCPGAVSRLEPHFQQVQAQWVGRLAEGVAQEGNIPVAQSLRPLYLRVSHAEAMRAQMGI